MKSCVEWWTALSAYVDDALISDERAKVEAHLQECEGCLEAVAELRYLRQSIRALPTYEPPPMLKARILSATVDQPTWTERLSIRWRQIAWRGSLACALGILVLVFAWKLVPQQVPHLMRSLSTPSVVKNTTASKPYSSAKQANDLQSVRVAANRTSQLETSVARKHPLKPKAQAPRLQVKWSGTPRPSLAPAPVPFDVLQGEPVTVEEDVPHIDVNSPPAGVNEQVAEQPDEAESRTVVTRFAIPAEVLSPSANNIDALREQIRIQNREQLSGQAKLKLQQKQLDVNVISVRF